MIEAVVVFLIMCLHLHPDFIFQKGISRYNPPRPTVNLPKQKTPHALSPADQDFQILSNERITVTSHILTHILKN